MTDLFKIRKEERIPSGVALLVIIALNVLMISKFWCLFVDYDIDSWKVFMRNFHMSGFDPITYAVVSDWNIGYNIIRHPLLPFLMYPVYLLNQLLWGITGVNCAPLLVGLILVTCAFYSFLFLDRIMREIIGIPPAASLLLCAFYFGLAYVMVTIIVPDHFCLSMFLILLLLYVSGRKLRSHTEFSIRETILLFVMTAGVTRSNRALVFLAVLVVNGRKFWKPRALLLGVVVPSMLMLGFAFSVNASEEIPQDQKVQNWTNSSIPRGETLIENFFGESLQLHRRHILGDALVNRPVIVNYSWSIQYVIEAMIILFFLWGAWTGRKDRFEWLVLGCLAFALLLHLVLGFAINEVYIMTAHWAYVIPLSLAYLLKRRNPCVEVLLFAITLYLWAYHVYLLWNYLTWPLSFK